MTTPTRPKLLATPTLSGPRSIQVGKMFFGIPKSAGVVTVGGGQLVYVLHRSRLHAYVQQGELEIPSAALRRALAARYFGATAPAKSSS